jgi:hypothetical protein
MEALTPVELVPEFAVLIALAISVSVSVEEMLIALPFMTISPERVNAVVELL